MIGVVTPYRPPSLSTSPSLSSFPSLSLFSFLPSLPFLVGLEGSPEGKEQIYEDSKQQLQERY